MDFISGWIAASNSEKCLVREMSRLSTPRRSPMRRALAMSVVAPITGIFAANRETNEAALYFVTE